jgi:hypothetical protein
MTLLPTTKNLISSLETFFIYHLKPDTLQFKPFMKIDTRVRAFEVQENRMICDETVFVKTENNRAKILQTLPKESYIHSMLAVGSVILLIGYQNNIKLA